MEILRVVYVCRDSERQREIANLEGQVYRFVELLGEQRAATRENVQRKQAQTGEERDESDEENISDDESDEDDDDIPYNPKNLPLGWDGKVSNAFRYAHPVRIRGNPVRIRGHTV